MVERSHEEQTAFSRTGGILIAVHKTYVLAPYLYLMIPAARAPNSIIDSNPYEYFPFRNCETATTARIDCLWSHVA